MATARFFFAIALIAAGCALLIVAEAPRPATAVWVGGGSHADHFSTREPLHTAQMNGLLLCTN